VRKLALNESYSKINKKLIKMSKVKLEINRFGRIGRIVLENFNRDNVEVVAINDLDVIT
jgi:hypothetical protein